jgi:hypothetical protein
MNIEILKTAAPKLAAIRKLQKIRKIEDAKFRQA